MYQVGRIYERLRQPANAIQSFAQILDRETELDATASPALKTILEMARWRKGHIEWQTRAEAAVPPAPPTPATNAPPITAKAPLPPLQRMSPSLLPDLQGHLALCQEVLSLVERESAALRGGELVARALHKQSPRAGAPFIKVNCAPCPKTSSRANSSATRKARSPAR